MTEQQIQQLAEERYPVKDSDELIGFPINIKELTLKARKDFIEGYRTALEGQWVSVGERPLFTIDNKGNWVCTEDAEKAFIAAVPYTNSKRPGKELWWIRHCVVEDEIGLCVVGDDDNTPAGWQLSDVTHWQPLPQPPKKNP